LSHTGLPVDGVDLELVIALKAEKTGDRAHRRGVTPFKLYCRAHLYPAFATFADRRLELAAYCRAGKKTRSKL
jgi:hypothetical protein